MMNSYQRFAEIRRLKQKEYHNKRLLAKLTNDHALMCRFETAYQAVYHVIPRVTKKFGWYTVHVISGTQSYRQGEFIHQTRILEAKIHERELENA